MGKWVSMAAQVVDSSGEKWLVERDDPAWKSISGAIKKGLPVEYQVVPLEVLLGQPLQPNMRRPDMDIDTRCRLDETIAALRVV